MACINAAITNHFVVLFWDMSDEAFYKIHNRDSFLNIAVILVTIVMESNKVTVILVNPRSGDDRASKIAADIFHDSLRVTSLGFCIDIESLFVFPVTEGLYYFKGRSDFSFHFIQKGGTKGIAEKGIVKMIDIAPETVITETTF